MTQPQSRTSAFAFPVLSSAFAAGMLALASGATLAASSPLDDPANVVEAIFAYYEARDIVPYETEQPHQSFL